MLARDSERRRELTHTSLRITSIENNSSPVTLKLQGKIVGEWVSLLKQECLMSIRRKERVCLDFGEVTYIDPRGLRMIRNLPERRVTIINAPAFIGDLMRTGG